VAQPRIFLLSPANCNGTRARQLLAPGATLELAARLRSREGAPLGELFAFVSGLYFRGKLRYASRFAMPPEPANPIVGSGVLIITPSAGLRSPETAVTAEGFRAFATADIHPDNPAYRNPLERSARTLAGEAGPGCDIVLLGSIASPKYTAVLLDIFGARLRFPAAFTGRGDMSRGGLLLRQVAADRELDYQPVTGAVLHGSRPPRLPPLPKSGSTCA
jgi:hypothetical protein